MNRATRKMWRLDLAGLPGFRDKPVSARTSRPDHAMPYLKAACGFLCFLILASNIWSMSRWNEARGVYDDVCYLRQAHLFKKFGFSGLDTNLARDDDHYLSLKLKEIGFPGWADVTKA